MAKGFDEAAWMAQDDARTLARAQEIYADGGRLKKAQAAAKKEYEAAMKNAGSMKNVFSAGGKATTKRTKK